NLVRGVESISQISEQDLLAAGVSRERLDRPNYVRARGMVDGADWFDPQAFGLNARDAALIDPQHRVFLECAWEALEDAGYDPMRFGADIGVYAGCGRSTYRRYLDRLNLSPLDNLALGIANEPDFLCTRVSHLLDLRGPSITVQTACSTSLVAVHLAIQALLTHQTDLT